LSEAAPEYAFKLLDILEQLHENLARDLACSSGCTTYGGLALGVLLLGMTGNWNFGIIWAAAIFGLDAWSQRRSLAYEFNIRDKLITSDLLNRLLLGPAYLIEPFSHVPWFVSLLNRRPAPSTLKGWLSFVGSNMDWYLAKPRYFIRIEWAVSAAAVAAFLGLAALEYSEPVIPSRYAVFPAHFLELGIIALLTVFTLSAISNVAKRRRVIGVHALLDHLRSHFFLWAEE